jgi:ligand-binding sensor domain-containing protein/signal transduction histidine kinase
MREFFINTTTPFFSSRYALSLGVITFRLLLFLVLIVLPAVLPQNLSAQAVMRFAHYSIEQGLSQSSALCALHDRRGFLWVGTEDGLNRFDGYSFTTFRNTSEKHSLSDSHVQSVYEDRSGRLWVGTRDGGINVFDGATEHFTAYKNIAKGAAAPTSLPSNDVHCITENFDGTLWIGTSDGLCAFDREKQTFRIYKNFGTSTGSPLTNNIQAIVADSAAGVLWLGTQDGIVKFTPKTGTSMILRSELPYPNVRALLKSRVFGGILWIGTDGGGLNALNVKTGVITAYSDHSSAHEQPEVYNQTSLYALCEDRTGKLWIGTYGDGLQVFDMQTKQFRRYKNEENRPSSLSNNFIFTIHEDLSGMIWIGTFGGGINQYNPALAFFTTFRRTTYNSQTSPTLSNNFVYSMLEDRQGELWVGTNNGLNKLLNREKGTFEQYFPSGEKLERNSLASTVRAILEDGNDMLWIATTDGLFKFNRRTKRFTPYRPPPLTNQNTANFGPGLLKDDEGMLWLGTSGAGLYRFNPQTGVFTEHFLHDAKNPTASLGYDNIYSLTHSRNRDTMWIGTNGGGFCAYSFRTHLFSSVYRYDVANANGLSNNTVRCIHEDHAGTLWIGTAGGLNKFDPSSRTFTVFRQKDGLPNNVVYGVLEDRRNNLWISTNKGLAKFNPKSAVNAKSPEKAFQTYDALDGLQNDEFNTGAYHFGASGRMYFGGISGLNEFYPDSVRKNTYAPPVVITGFRKANIPVTDLPQAISVTREIEIPARENVISFEFTALNFTLPEKNQYAYKLDGFDANWIYCGSRREATYTNLGGGTYTFRVKAANNDDVWNEEGASLRLIILPPWWQRWWAQLGGAVAVGLLIFAAYRQRVHSIEETNRFLQETVDERTREVQRQIMILNDLAQEIELANTELQDRNNQVETKNVQFAEVNKELAEKNMLLDQTLDELHSLNQDLESRIHARTTELDAANKALGKSLVQEQEINKLRARLIASISHEFRTPITIIQSSCGILQRYIDKMGTEQRQKQFNHIEESSKRLVSILDAVITMSTIENRKPRLMPTDVVIRAEELARDFNLLQQQEFGEQAHEIRFTSNVSNSILNIDEESLRQILSNIVSNALKFSPPRTPVDITLTQNDETVLWTVHDEGMGIGEEDKPYIFDLFYRSEKTESSTIQGVGLGLSIVKKLVENLQGRMWFESAIGQGTTFYVELPIHQAENAEVNSQ